MLDDRIIITLFKMIAVILLTFGISGVFTQCQNQVILHLLEIHQYVL